MARFLRPDSFHAPAGGTDPEDLSECYACGHETYESASFCTQCGARMQSRRSSRRYGWVLLVCGLLITSTIGAVLYYTAPLLLRPGLSIGGSRFSGTAAQASVILGILGMVALFGVTAAAYGLWQIKTGRRNRKVVYFVVGLAALLYLIAAAIHVYW